MKKISHHLFTVDLPEEAILQLNKDNLKIHSKCSFIGKYAIFSLGRYFLPLSGYICLDMSAVTGPNGSIESLS